MSEPKRVLHRCLVPGLAAALVLAALVARGQSPRNREPLRHVTGTATWQEDGQSRSAEVDMQKWIIGAHQKLEALPLPGSGVHIVQLAAGEVATVIGGERVERAEGEIWSLRPSQAMGIETEDDAAILLTVSVRVP